MAMSKSDRTHWIQLGDLSMHLYFRAKNEFSGLDDDLRFEIERYDDELAGAMSYLRNGRVPERSNLVVRALQQRVLVGGRGVLPSVVTELLAFYDVLGAFIVDTILKAEDTHGRRYFE